MREQQQLEEVLRRLADPSSPEALVAQKAYRRIAELLEELKLDEGHLELATQAGFPCAHSFLQEGMLHLAYMQCLAV